MIETLKVYPYENKLDAIIEYEECSVPFFCNFSFLHKWRTVEKWYFKFFNVSSDGVYDSAQICAKCGALRRFMVSRGQEGDVMASGWEKFGYVLLKWRDYDPYNIISRKIEK